jgi:hypothetical protein
MYEEPPAGYSHCPRLVCPVSASGLHRTQPPIVGAIIIVIVTDFHRDFYSVMFPTRSQRRRHFITTPGSTVTVIT